jgi:hypothetical protein
MTNLKLAKASLKDESSSIIDNNQIAHLNWSYIFHI